MVKMDTWSRLPTVNVVENAAEMLAAGDFFVFFNIKCGFEL